MTTRVGPMVAALAAAKGVTHAELAAELGVHRNRFSDKIKGRLPFRESEIVVLADYFGVEPGRLFEDPLELLGVTSTSGPVWDRIIARQSDLALAA